MFSLVRLWSASLVRMKGANSQLFHLLSLLRSPLVLMVLMVRIENVGTGNVIAENTGIVVSYDIKHAVDLIKTSGAKGLAVP